MSHHVFHRVFLSRALLVALAVSVSACARDRKAEVAPAEGGQQPEGSGRSSVCAHEHLVVVWAGRRAPAALSRATKRCADRLPATASRMRVRRRPDWATRCAPHPPSWSRPMPRSEVVWRRPSAPRREVAGATDLATARHAFAELSQALIAIAAVDARVAEGLHLFECPMVEKPNRWLQPSRAIDNPYMGAAMATCGVEHELRPPSSALPDASGGAAANADEVAGPGAARCTPTCAATGRASARSARWTWSPSRVARSRAARSWSMRRAVRPSVFAPGWSSGGPRREIRAAGPVVFDETASRTSRSRSAAGSASCGRRHRQPRRGQTLFTLYSPELYAAQREYLAALAQPARARARPARPSAPTTWCDAARQRLRLWDVRGERHRAHRAERRAARVRCRSARPRAATWSRRTSSRARRSSPASGSTASRRSIASGSRPRSTSRSSPLVAVGKQRESHAAVPARADASRARSRTSTPASRETRTGARAPRARQSRPRAAARHVRRRALARRGERLMVPAVGRAPRRASAASCSSTSARGGSARSASRSACAAATDVESARGLEAGERVVASGTFLVAAESRLRAALEQWMSTTARARARSARAIDRCARDPGSAPAGARRRGVGRVRVRRTPLDAIPDLSDVQVIVFTEWTGRSPDLVEDQITYPISTALLAAPGVRSVRGQSLFGMSFVYVIFEDGTDLYWARSRVLEYLSERPGRSCPKASCRCSAPTPPASAGSSSTRSSIDSGQHDLAELRSLQDWNLRYALESVRRRGRGRVGRRLRAGSTRCVVDPGGCARYGISLREVSTRCASRTRTRAAQSLEIAGHEYVVRGRGYVSARGPRRGAACRVAPGGAPVLLRRRRRGPARARARRGIAELDGEGEVVGGIVVMRYGENALAVIDAREAAPRGAAAAACRRASSS